MRSKLPVFHSSRKVPLFSHPSSPCLPFLLRAGSSCTGIWGVVGSEQQTLPQSGFTLEHRAGRTSFSVSEVGQWPERHHSELPSARCPLPISAVTPYPSFRTWLRCSSLRWFLILLLQYRGSPPPLNSPSTTFFKPFYRMANGCSVKVVLVSKVREPLRWYYFWVPGAH